MSAILAILLMLSGAILIPHAFAQTPAAAVQCNPANLTWQYPAHAPGGPGDTWTMYADVVNADHLFSFQIGFYFDPTAVQIVSVSEGGFLSSLGGTLLSFPGSIDNVAGKVLPYGWSLTDTTKAPTGSGHLITVQAKINPTLTPPYTGTYPGTPVLMMDLGLASEIQLILMYNDGVTEITPSANHIYDGYFTLGVTVTGPTAAFAVTPTPVYVGTSQLFDASASLPGSNGYAVAPIVNYHWVFADGNVTDTPTAITSHLYAGAGDYDVFLTVTDSDGLTSTIDHHAVVQELPTGCNIDLTSQNWRYIDPETLQGVPNGALTDSPADLFRPGDFVQMYALVTYANDPVQHQLVSFQVFDNLGNTVLVGTAFSDANGVAYYEFRVPWPCVGVENEFGTWMAVATWQVGSLFPDVPPFEKTQIDTMPFKVGWGLWITDISTDKTLYHKSEMVVVKIHVENDYMVPVPALATVDIYDDLLVPINGPASVAATFPVGITEVTFAGIHVEKWAFCGTGTAKANVFTTWPIDMGTSFCPEVTTTFSIKP